MAHISEAGEDLRIRRTRKLLLRALFEATVDKGYAAVTVSDIVTRAEVNRSTFYRHYLDKADLLSKHMDELQAEIAEAAARAMGAASPAPDKLPAGLLLLIKHVQQNADFYRVMLGPSGDPAFTHRFRQLSEQRYRSVLARVGSPADPSAPPAELTLRYISHAVVGALLWWLENGQPSTAEALAVWLSRLNMTMAGIALKR